MKKISFLVPVYNKQHAIEATIGEIRAGAASLSLQFEIIAVDDGSTDRSLELLRALAGKVPELRVFNNERNQGFARTYARCVELADAEYVMYISGDNDVPATALVTLLSHIGEAEVVLQCCENISSRPIVRRLISQSFTNVMNRINGLEVKYYNGFNIYPLKVLKGIEIRESSFAFQAEIVSKMLDRCTFIQVGIPCGFHDSKTSAFRPANLAGVAGFVLRSYLRKRKWTR